MAYKVLWTINGSPATVDQYLSVSFPQSTSGPITLVVTSPAAAAGTMETLNNVKFFLDGPDANLLQSWTTISTTQTILNGGVDISFDTGITWTTFNSSSGLKSNNSTWILLPGSAISPTALDGQLSPYDSGTMLIRVRIPSSFSDYRVLSFLIGTDFDVV